MGEPGLVFVQPRIGEGEGESGRSNDAIEQRQLCFEPAMRQVALRTGMDDMEADGDHGLVAKRHAVRP
jgi:hypothetical protein